MLKLLCRVVLLGVVVGFSATAYAEFIRGIYVTQPSLENTKTIKYLIRNARQTGINTFIIDVHYFSKRYRRNIALVKKNNIRYVARIVVFPRGGSHSQVVSKQYWNKKYRLVQRALDLGAEEVQLDYIRYSVKRYRSKQNAHNILRVIQWFKQRINGAGAKLQLAVFGETCYGPSLAIGQDLKLFFGSFSTLNPMVYPSHYYPYRYHSERPYSTIYDCLIALNHQFNNQRNFKLYPYIEVNNFRYRYSRKKRLRYIYQQIKAVQDAGADGWYAWSPTNKYYFLFQALRTYSLK